MATITLEYDGRNKLMQDLIALLEKYGAKRKDVAKEDEDPTDITLKAIEEIRSGKGIRCKTFEEYKDSVRNL
ncbi:MAG: hypothetical protein IJK62_03125 [Bacteroidales bacterium]|nr:hypothetical protein [Bacteroidales bacterium]